MFSTHRSSHPVNVVFICFTLVLTLTVSHTEVAGASPEVPFEQGDHVTLVGNALPERMNHFGYFETLLHDRFPDKQLVVRNIGYAGDVVNEDKNLRVSGYPGRDQWLTMLQTDVLFVMYGFNESFRGPDGVNDFHKQLDAFVRHVTQTKYNGNSPPEVILVSPIASEDTNDPHLPDGSQQNKHLKRYTDVIKQVAESHDILFLNLFSATKKQYNSSDRNLTFNGIHLTEYGYRQLAETLDQKLFGDRETTIDWNDLKDLRTAVNDKNEYWFDRYRVNDQNDIYGSRSKLSWNGISNREVLQRELEILDTMVAQRDKKIWATAQGNSFQVTDKDLPELINVPEDTPGQDTEKRAEYLGGKEAIQKMTLHDNLQVNLFASEERFPELINPAQIQVDPSGRLWVAAWEAYPTYEPPGKKRDDLIILEDTNEDGVADKRTIFASELKNPTGFHFWNGGVLVTQPPYIMFLKDTEGDGQADMKRRMLSHISSADTHHTANSYLWGPGGKLYFQEGVFHRTQVETPYGPVRNKNGGVWQFDPETYRLKRHSPYALSNPHGHDRTRWNQGLITDAPPGRTYHDAVISGFLPYPKTHPNAPDVVNSPAPVGANCMLSSGNFPDQFQNNLLLAVPQNPRALMQYDLKRDGANYRGEKRPQILSSDDPNFRPVDVEIGSDGAIYVADWHNRVIDHMHNHIRHPARDHTHGRIYRITHKNRSLSPRQELTTKSIPELFDLLKDPANHVRTRARLALSTRSDRRVRTALSKWLDQRSPNEPSYEHHMLEGLWTYQRLHQPNEKLLKNVLEFNEPRARAAAVRVITDWKKELKQPLDLLETTINDSSALVRLESLRALSHFSSQRARNIAKQVRNHTMDKYLKYSLKETMRAFTAR